MAGEILLSVITVVRNGRSLITATLESVERLKSPGIEYIVIDGDSNDGTQVAIEPFRGVIDTYVSEPDRGIYDAMNKAARLARGKFLLHINAGDALMRAPLAELAALAPEVQVAAFPVELSHGRKSIPHAGLLLSFDNSIHHQGACYRSAGLPPYDLAYKTFADFDLNQRLRSQTLTFAQAAPLASHATGGQSHDRGNFHEVYAIVRKNTGQAAVLLSWLYFKFKGLRGRISSRFHSLS